MLSILEKPMKHNKYFLILFLLLLSCTIIPDDPSPGVIEIHPKLQDGFKICVIGDSGKGGSEQKQVAAALVKANCQQVRHLGDIIYNSGLDSTDDPLFKERFYNYYQELFKQNIEFYMALGNHDYRGNPSAWLHIAKIFPNIKFPSMYYATIYEDICFITLDTNSRYMLQQQWFKKLQQEFSSQCKLVITLGHHPLYSSGLHGNASMLRRIFLEKVTQGKVDAYLAGHEHNQEDCGQYDKTHYFVSGSAGASRSLRNKPPVWGSKNSGFMTLTIHYDENKHPYFNYQFYEVESHGPAVNLIHSGTVKGQGFR